eukprot:GEMP01102310.1.p1 GENE.GEMP01102310.1~~GEMP01102310.1.p1  ORF type:complete len:100 (-),score=9.98 GEMP01102310.1:445-744(-)
MSGKPEEGHPSIVEDLDFINGKLEEGHPNIVGDLDFIKEHYKDCFQALEIESKDYEADRAVFTFKQMPISRVYVATKKTVLKKKSDHHYSTHFITFDCK